MVNIYLESVLFVFLIPLC